MTRWSTAVHAGFLAAAATAGTAYAIAGPHLRPLIFSLVTLVPIVTFAGALAAGHLPDRRPWMTATGD